MKQGSQVSFRSMRAKFGQLYIHVRAQLLIMLTLLMLYIRLVAMNNI